LGVGICDAAEGGGLMSDITLEIPQVIYGELWKHLLPRRQRDEEAAFCFAQAVQERPHHYEVIDWRRILPADFEYQSAYHLELGDKVRAEIVKRAHDLSASIVEFHSHVFGEPPEFSCSDIQGFEETVPHCLWRLKGRPYFAVVVSTGGFDGLAWLTKDGQPRQIGWIVSGGEQLNASRKTILNYE
jgi:hypothetical protein